MVTLIDDTMGTRTEKATITEPCVTEVIETSDGVNNVVAKSWFNVETSALTN